jgi:hypothetical protein
MINVILKNPITTKWEVEKAIDAHKRGETVNYTSSDQAFFDHLRLAIAENRVSSDDVRFEFKGKQLQVNEYGGGNELSRKYVFRGCRDF